jgi:hypothetical protein
MEVRLHLAIQLHTQLTAYKAGFIESLHESIAAR